MKSCMMARSKGQVYSVGNYLMTGKVLGKGHFARVEEATHRIIGKKVAIKIIDLTCIKEEYARRNLHREPSVMARLRHPCIAALYETMMHGPRLYVVMEAAGGGDLCALVLGARGGAGGGRGLPEPRARALAAQLVSAVRHMHARGVVHRDLKMENIMLDSTKNFIKIVDFGLSNVWNSVGGLHTPCGSLEYAAPELFRDTRRYGPELDLWSIGVIVYGMVTGALPFVGSGGAAEAEGRSRPQLRAAIARGFSRKHRAALVAFSSECRAFIQHLLEPNVETRMKIEEAARHRWLKRPGMKMRTHPLGDVDLKLNREIYKEISDLCSASVTEIASQIKAEPYGAMAGMYNIKAHLTQLNALPFTDPLWSNTPETRPVTPPEYKPHRPSETIVRPLSAYESKVEKHEVGSKPSPPPHMMRPVNFKAIGNGDCSERPSTTPSVASSTEKSRENRPNIDKNHIDRPHIDRPIIDRPHIDRPHIDRPHIDRPHIDRPHIDRPHIDRPHIDRPHIDRPHINRQQLDKPKVSIVRMDKPENPKPALAYNSIIRPARSKPIYKVCDNGDGAESRLPSIAEHRKLDEGRWSRIRDSKTDEDRRKLNTCPARVDRRADFYRRAGDAVPKYENWRAHGNTSSLAPPARILLQSNATTIKRASLGNITSPHSSANSYCKSERAMPVGWYSTRSANKESAAPSLQRLRRTAPIK